MRFANIDGRACIAIGAQYFDIAKASGGRFSGDVQATYASWPDLIDWYASDFDPAGQTPIEGRLGAPAPAPTQVFGIGVNYADHAAEAAFALPKAPLVFPKFASCIVSPEQRLPLDADTVDWEVELVVVIGQTARRVSEQDAWGYVAGLTIGQDISDRALQFSDPANPQFGLGKSKFGYGPIGPVVVTPGEFDDPDNLAISCFLNGELVQQSNTSKLIFNVAALVSYLSTVVTLCPGDLIFTGTPSGVGMAHTPPRYLVDGDALVSSIEGIGSIVTTATRDDAA
jgi:2,4-diketo-3-deoxy-L-fuconate hydrolase